MKKYVELITTGGTIASLPNEDGDVKASIDGQAFIEHYGIEGDIKVTSSMVIDSSNFTYELLYKLAKDVMSAVNDPEVEGIVITHGTDTMEETAFYLSLFTQQYSKPIILTGSQFDASYAFSDGVKNLHDAIQAARSPQLFGCGPVIVFAGFIYSAREVTKVDTNSLEAFGSTAWGPMGRIDDNKIILVRHAKAVKNLELKQLHSVALIRLVSGMTGEELRRMTEGFEGIVVESFGRGNANKDLLQTFVDLVQHGKPVIITSRCHRGEVKPYYGDGGGRDLERAGVWFAGDLDGIKARILLGLLLANNLSWDEMHEVVRAYSQPHL